MAKKRKAKRQRRKKKNSTRRPARPQKCGQETQGGKSAGKAAAETGSAKTETAVRLPSVAVAPGQNLPEPAAAWSFTPWVRVVNGLRSVRA